MLEANGIEFIVLNNGQVLPVPMGGSDTETFEDVQGLDDTDDLEDLEDEFDLDDEDDDEDEYSNLGDGFLQGVPEEHRELLQPYVKQWDAGVTRRFQQLQSALGPYQELGDLEDLQNRLEILDWIENNTEEFYQRLAERFGDQGQGTTTEQPPTGAEAGFQGLPQEFQDKFQKMESALEVLAEHFLSQQEQEQTQAEDEELDNILSNLHDEFGEFDDEYVMVKMYNGMEPAKAVKSFFKFQERAAQRIFAEQGLDRMPPGILGGGGSAPSEPSQRLGDIPKKDVQAFVTNILAQASQNGQ